MNRADELNTDLWRVLAKYDLEVYADALMDVLESHGGVTEEWFEEDEGDDDE